MTRAALLPAMGLLAVSLAALPPAARAGGAEPPGSTPQAIVEALYRPYLADPHAEKDTTIDSVAQVRRHATPALARLLDADRACEKRTQGICALDFDIIIDGQDWDLSGFGLQAEASGDTATVTARFNNFGPRVLAYHFARTGGRWLIDDVVILKDDAGAADHPWSLKDTLVSEYGATGKKHR
ncbi:uncharacterized protein DUF3828 [Nitrospirillum amazonense]|uniref:Uncharacterized protein DUF3828 n=1 Tax=Nitrospirillum amazonense TaxID=28077 RepID=A0A560JXB2_9PROT|nr:DUF3828 domain-containing protein [Nitrospirillum amazonense]TWB75596.1 uncharacterized protein DUF3828 [Nitrospirillum amazonense]